MLEGQPMISIIGMGDVAVKEAGDRIQSAIDESGYVFPKKKVIISLAPGDRKKRGAHFDHAMANLQMTGGVSPLRIHIEGVRPH